MPCFTKTALAACLFAFATGLKSRPDENVTNYSDEAESVQMTDDVLAMFGEQLIAFQVGQEAAQARRYLDLVMKLQTAYYQSTAAQLYVNKMYIDYQAKHGRGAAPAIPGQSAFMEMGVQTADNEVDFDAHDEARDEALDELAKKVALEEEDEDAGKYVDEEPEVSAAARHTATHLNHAGTTSHQLQLLGSLNLFHAVKLMGTTCIYKAHDLQENFYAERALQLKVGLFGADVFPPEVLSLIYMVMVSSYLKTQSLSLALQAVSTFTTYLEDELDYGATVVKNPSRVTAADGFMGEELADDKLWAFSAFNKYASLELTIFCLDYYVTYQSMQLFGASGANEQQMQQKGGRSKAATAARMNVMSKMPPPTADMMRMFQQGPLGGFGGGMSHMMGGTSQPGGISFLEVGTETEAETKTKTKFFAALFAPFLLGGDFDLYTAIYTFYQLTMQYMASNAGLQSAYAHKAALQNVDNPNFNRGVPAKAMEHSKLLFGSFASNLQQVANVGYITSMWELYALYQEWATAPEDPFQQSQQATEQSSATNMRSAFRA